MGNQKEAPPPPDTSKYSDAAFADGQRSSNWAQEMWDLGQQEWENIRDWTGQYLDQAFPAMEDMFGWAAEAKDFYDTNVVPAMQSLFTEAEKYASKGEETRQRASAIQDTNQAIEAQRAASKRRLEGFGVDPSEVAQKSLDRTSGVMQGAAQALAANQAAERTKAIGRDLTAQAVQMGQQAGQMGQNAAAMGSNIGQGAVNTAVGAGVGGSQMMQAAVPFQQMAYGGYDLGAGIVDTAYGRDLQKTEIDNAANQANFNQMMSIGKSIGGMGSMLPIPGLAAEGGPIAAPGGPTDDRGAIAISDGEYVIPADVVRRLGTNHFDKLIEKETGRPPPSQKQALPIDGNRMPSEPQPAATGQMLTPQAGVLR